MLNKNFVSIFDNTFYIASGNARADMSGAGNVSPSALIQQRITNVRARSFSGLGSYVYMVYISLGTGDTPATNTDYKLDSVVNLTFVNGTITYNTGNSLFIVSSNYRNDTESSVTIKELGFGLGYHQANGNGTSALISRSVLDTPVTINAGETYAFTYSIEI